MELSKKVEQILEENDFKVCGEISERYHENDTYDIDLETYSPAGEDIIISLTYDGTEEDFIRAFDEYANDFDADEHATNWIEARGMVRGVPNSVRDLIEDAEWIKDTLTRIAEELIGLDNEPEDKENTVNEVEKRHNIQLVEELLEIMEDYRRKINSNLITDIAMVLDTAITDIECLKCDFE